MFRYDFAGITALFMKPVRALVIGLFFVLMPALPLFAQGAADDAIFEYKQNYEPVEYLPEPNYRFYVDVVVLALLMLAVPLLMSGKLRRFRGIIGWLPAVTFIYFGILRGGCICPVGATGNAVIGLFEPELIGWTTLLIFLLPLFMALIMGRVFCTSGCPLGAVQDMFYSRKHNYRLPRLLRITGTVAAVMVLAATVWFALSGRFFFICHIDPYRTLFHQGYVWVRKVESVLSGTSSENRFFIAESRVMWMYLGIILLIGIKIPRVFCRFICPYGVLLGLLSLVSFKRRSIDSESCVFCGRCEKVCPVQSISIDRENRKAELSNFSCVQCDRCSSVCPRDSVK